MSVTLNKTVLAIGAVLIVAGLIWSTISTRIELTNTRYELELAKASYSYMAREKARLDSIMGFYQYSVAIRDTAIAINTREINKKDAEIVLLRKRLSNTLINAAKETADSSYKNIQERVPATSEQNYKFDSLQVKAIYYTFVERDGLKVLSDSLTSYNYDLQQLSLLKDNQIMDLKSLNNVYVDKLSLCEMKSAAYISENKGLTKDAKKQKVKNTASNLGLLGLAVVVLALIL